MNGDVIFLLYALVIAAMAVLLARVACRINRVQKFRMELIDQIAEAARSDIVAAILTWPSAPDLQWRWDAFEKVSFDDMVRLPWKPLDSYYPDRSFTTSVRVLQPTQLMPYLPKDSILPPQSHADRWAQKYLKECPECKGTGVRRCYSVSATTFEGVVDPMCEACKGTGKVPNE